MSKFNPPQWSTPPVSLTYGVAVLSVTVALICAWCMEILLQSAAPVSLLLCAVMSSAWFGGIKPALLSIALAVLAFDYYSVPPIHSLPWRLNNYLVFFFLRSQPFSSGG